MPEFDLESAQKKFYSGKLQLDSGGFSAAIKIYDEVIADNDRFKDVPDAKALVENALNNRGVAKCKSGLRTNNEALYREGIKDYQDSVTMEGEISDLEKQGLNAQRNFRYAEDEVKVFKERRKIQADNTSWYLSE